MEDHKNKLPVKQSGQKKVHDDEAASKAEDSKEGVGMSASFTDKTITCSVY